MFIIIAVRYSCWDRWVRLWFDILSNCIFALRESRISARKKSWMEIRDFYWLKNHVLCWFTIWYRVFYPKILLLRKNADVIFLSVGNANIADDTNKSSPDRHTNQNAPCFFQNAPCIFWKASHTSINCKPHLKKSKAHFFFSIGHCHILARNIAISPPYLFHFSASMKAISMKIKGQKNVFSAYSCIKRQE